MELSNNPLVSCIIIFLNAEKFLREAIESIFSQSYNNWEILLVDDGSTDGSTEIASEYSIKYPLKVFYLSHNGHQNLGMSASRNLGICRAQGELIAFLDSDDVWLPDKLLQQIEIMNAYPEAGMIYGRTKIWYSWNNGTKTASDYFVNLGVQPERLIQPPELFYYLLRNKFQTPTTCNALLRKEIFNKVGRFEESFRGMYEDQVFFSKVLLQTPVYVSDRYWANYRQRPESYHEGTNEYCINRLPFLRWLITYLERTGIGRNSKTYRSVQKELWLCKRPVLFRIVDKSKKLVNKMMGL